MTAVSRAVWLVCVVLAGPGCQGGESFDSASDDGATTHHTAQSQGLVGSWSVVGTPAVGRILHQSVLLDTGEVLSAGGLFEWNDQSAAELFNPTTGQWRPAASMRNTRVNHALVKLANGDVLAVGNWNTDRTAEVYTNGAWRFTDNSPDYREKPTATLMGNGNVLMTGGGYELSAKRSWLYNPDLNQWSPSADLQHALVEHTATLLSDGNSVLITGGIYDPGPSIPDTSSNYTWTYVNGNVFHTGVMLTSRHRHTATLLKDGRVLVLGGIRTPSTLSALQPEIYSSNGQWNGARMPPTPRFETHTATLLKDGRVLLLGGRTTPGGACSTAAEVYDPSTDTWAIAPSMSYPRCWHTATLLKDGRVLVDGSDGYSALPSEVFTP